MRKIVLMLMLVFAILMTAGCNKISAETTQPTEEEVLVADETSSVTPSEAYEAILDEYKTACLDSEYLSVRNNNEEDLKELYPDVYMNISMAQYHGDYNTSNFYYTYYDIDNNGTDELLIGNGDDAAIYIVDVYSFDGTKAVKLIDNEGLADRSSLKIFTDGTMYEYNSSGAMSGSSRFSQIDEDGCSNISIKEYEVDGYTYPDTPYISGSESLTETEYLDMLAEYTEVTAFDWNILTEIEVNTDLAGTYVSTQDGNDTVLEISSGDYDKMTFSWDFSGANGKTIYEGVLVDGVWYVYITLPSDTATLTITQNEDLLIIEGDEVYNEHSLIPLAGTFKRLEYTSGENVDQTSQFLGVYANGYYGLKIYEESNILHCMVGSNAHGGWFDFEYSYYELSENQLTAVRSIDGATDTFILNSDGSVSATFESFDTLDMTYIPNDGSVFDLME